MSFNPLRFLFHRENNPLEASSISPTAAETPLAVFRDLAERSGFVLEKVSVEQRGWVAEQHEVFAALLEASFDVHRNIRTGAEEFNATSLPRLLNILPTENRDELLADLKSTLLPIINGGPYERYGADIYEGLHRTTWALGEHLTLSRFTGILHSLKEVMPQARRELLLNAYPMLLQLECVTEELNDGLLMRINRFVTTFADRAPDVLATLAATLIVEREKIKAERTYFEEYLAAFESIDPHKKSSSRYRGYLPRHIRDCARDMSQKVQLLFKLKKRMGESFCPESLGMCLRAEKHFGHEYHSFAHQSLECFQDIEDGKLGVPHLIAVEQARRRFGDNAQVLLGYVLKNYRAERPPSETTKNSYEDLCDLLDSRTEVGRVVEYCFDPDNHFTSGLTDFGTRFWWWREKSFTPALQVDATRHNFSLRANIELSQTDAVLKRDQHGKQLSIDISAIKAIDRRFSIQSDNHVKTILEEVAKLGKFDLTESDLTRALKFFSLGNYEHFTNILRQSFQRMAERNRDLAFNHLVPVLPTLFGWSKPKLNEDTPSQVRDYLTSMLFFLSAHVPEHFQNLGIEFPTGQADSKKAPTSRILKMVRSCEGELAKFAQTHTNSMLRIGLVATKSLPDAFYDALGQGCIRGYGFDLGKPYFQPIRMVDLDAGLELGINYALKGSVNGEPALILAGVEPRKALVNAVRASEFVAKLLDNLKVIADENDLKGGVYMCAEGIGGMINDDGRIAQYPSIKNALVQAVSNHLGLVDFIILPLEERIQFPDGFKIPITSVVKLR